MFEGLPVAGSLCLGLAFMMCSILIATHHAPYIPHGRLFTWPCMVGLQVPDPAPNRAEKTPALQAQASIVKLSASIIRSLNTRQAQHWPPDRFQMTSDKGRQASDTAALAAHSQCLLSETLFPPLYIELVARLSPILYSRVLQPLSAP